MVVVVVVAKSCSKHSDRTGVFDNSNGPGGVKPDAIVSTGYLSRKPVCQGSQRLGAAVLLPVITENLKS